jgi:hypothetical protein
MLEAWGGGQTTSVCRTSVVVCSLVDKPTATGCCLVTVSYLYRIDTVTVNDKLRQSTWTDARNQVCSLAYRSEFLLQTVIAFAFSFGRRTDRMRSKLTCT